MTKSKFMRVAAILMAAVLLTTCAISGTFAKYVTSDNATDSARVAKWGVTVDAGSGAFAKQYDKSDSNYEGTLSVEAEDKVVAPGTSGSLAVFTLDGTPEVACRVSYAATVELEDWEIESDEYCPIVVTVNGTEFKIDGEDITTVAELKAAIEAEINGYSKDYAPGTDLSTKTADDLAVSWAWAFSTSAANDVKDTALGDAAAAGSAPTIAIDVTCTVTQID